MTKEQKKQGKNKKAKKSTQLSEVSTVQCAENIPTVQCFYDEQSKYVGDYDRLRGFALELYASPEHWGTLLDEAEHFAYIFHDRDKKEDGTLKTPHYHVLIRFKNAKTKSAVRKLTNLDNLTENTTLNFQKLIDTKGAFSYLTHTTKKAIVDGKTVYALDEVTCDKLSYWQDVSSAGTTENEDFIADLCYNRLSRKELAIKYGRDYMKNMARYDDFREQVLFQDSREKLLANQKTLIEIVMEDSDSFGFAMLSMAIFVLIGIIFTTGLIGLILVGTVFFVVGGPVFLGKYFAKKAKYKRFIKIHNTKKRSFIYRIIRNTWNITRAI